MNSTFGDCCCKSGLSMIDVAHSSNVYMRLVSRKRGLFGRSCIIAELKYWKQNDHGFQVIKYTCLN